MATYTKEEQLELIKRDYYGLKYIENQYDEVCLQAVKLYGTSIQFVKNKTYEICLEAVKKNGNALCYVPNELRTEDICLQAVKSSGLAISFIEKPSYELCLEAVKQTGRALKYINEQTYELCLEAVKQDGRAIAYSKIQTEEICLEAVKENSYSISKIKSKTPKLCFYAFLGKYELLEYKYIKNGIDKFIKSNPTLTNEIFFLIDIDSLIYVKEYLLKQKNNKYVLSDNENTDMLKEISLSNNELIIIDTGNIKNIHRMLANKIIKFEDIKKWSFK